MKQYAIKRIPRISFSKERDQESISAWKTEAQQIAAINDPNLVPIADFFFDRESKYFVYEYQESGNLRQFLADAEQLHKLSPIHV